MITKSMNLFMELLKDESGQDLIEYALVAGIVGLGAVVSLGNLDTRLKNAFANIGTTLTNAT